MNVKDKVGLPREEKGTFYEIKLKGQLEVHWADWLGGMTISHDRDGYTRLTGVIQDQAALHGILAQIRDLGLDLVSLSTKEKIGNKS